MTVTVTLAQIRKLAPNVRSSYSTAFDVGQPILDHYGISDNPLRVVHFMAQVLHECGALKIQWESLYYTPKRLPEVWPKRFKPKGKLEPKEYAYNEEKLGDAVYGGRLGNDQPGDGFKYRGRAAAATYWKRRLPRYHDLAAPVAAGCPGFRYRSGRGAQP